MTLAEHAEMWWKEMGHEVPPRVSDEWRRMYEEWVAYAFAEL